MDTDIGNVNKRSYFVHQVFSFCLHVKYIKTQSRNKKGENNMGMFFLFLAGQQSA